MFLINEYGNVKVSSRRNNASIFDTCSPFCCPKTSFVNLLCKRDRIQPFMYMSVSTQVFVRTVLKYCVLMSVIKIYFYRYIIRWFLLLFMWKNPCRVVLVLCGCTRDVEFMSWCCVCELSWFIRIPEFLMPLDTPQLRHVRIKFSEGEQFMFLPQVLFPFH